MEEADEVGFSLRGRDSGGGSSTVWFRVHGAAELGPIVLSSSDDDALGVLIDALIKLLSDAVELQRSERSCAAGTSAASRPSGVQSLRIAAHEE